MPGQIEGRVAIVTGGGRGIGRAVALGLASEGATVAVLSRTAQQLEETVNAIEAKGGHAIALEADISDQRQVNQAVARTEAELGPVDVLINNAGVIGPPGRLWEVEADEWCRAIEIDVCGQYRVTRAVLQAMVTRRRGRIINISSGAATIPGGYPGFSAYAASKAALNRMTETLSTEVREFGISVFAIHPGVVRTELLKVNFDSGVTSLQPGRAERMWEVNTPLEQPVALCVYLASGAADKLSGCFLSVSDDYRSLAAQAREIREKDLYRMRVNRLPA